MRSIYEPLKIIIKRCYGIRENEQSGVSVFDQRLKEEFSRLENSKMKTIVFLHPVDMIGY